MNLVKSKSLLDWLTELENRHQQEIQLGLDRVKQVGSLLKLLDLNALIITVAGTNGKGTTVSALESIYSQAGYKVASYTSPHLIKFNERIRINQQPIADEELTAAFTAIDGARGDIPLTYFEMTTLAALWCFKQHDLDVIVLEVGLGGRLDAVNCIDTDLAIITTIDYDHEAYLGNTLEAIGYEKAGIIRHKKPIIYADKNPPQSIIQHALSCAAPMYRYGHEYSYQVHEKITFTFNGNRIVLPNIPLHANSIAAALMATFCLQEQLPVNLQHRIEGIAEINLAGRLQLITHPHKTILDVAHNPQATEYLAKYLMTNYANVRIHAVFSAFADKDIVTMIKPFKSCIQHWYPALLSGKRAASASQLLSSLEANEIYINKCYNTPFLAYQAACKQVNKHDLIVVFGSFIIVGTVLSTLYQ
ncbi:dihydrofolate:folylpolyglutamate synthetase FolC [Legionella beliardensis]|uniref:Dihydrofolate synthase/folylpolyglutamate synthase n=1 Tax=Legionella beliardensis TaxID=91822 RepID=A0A378I9N3_9GAMM|nr:bifunctional tetrahydrofolate synthase/dihydrofolate synthase [Legionella beliardensis]STX29084.1 dihydrofolate:folylpolyglutamate synthetase FolC [Legionella beliardensis]